MERLSMSATGRLPSPIATILAGHLTPDELAGPPRVSVWACAQQHPRAQRASRYLPEAAAHPGAMLPEIARRVIETYTRPGETVLDPLCGTGTVLVEAAHAGRYGIGIETDRRWAEVAARNAERTSAEGAAKGAAYVWQRPKPSTLPSALYEHYQGRIALALTALPSIQARRPRPSRCGQSQVSAHYSRCMQDPKALMLTFADVLRSTRELLKPGGLIAVAARTQYHRGQLIDYPSAVISAGRIAGLAPVDRLVILTRRIARNSTVGTRFADPTSCERHRAGGHRDALCVHQDLILLSVE
jgi:SAM-dependent methyltransferase